MIPIMIFADLALARRIRMAAQAHAGIMRGPRRA
jgi:hypothetical protein